MVWGGSDKVGKSLGVAHTIIDVFEENVGEKDLVVGHFEVSVDGGHDLLDRIGGGDGH